MSPLYLLYIKFTCWCVWHYLTTLNRCQFLGLEHIPPATSPALFLANHISQYETLAIPAAVVLNQRRFSIRAAAKEELLHAPVIGWIMRSFKIIPVKRGRAAKAFASIISHVQQGISVMIFPEGTRSKDGKLGNANRGMGKLMIDTGVPIVPIHVSGFRDWKPFRLGQRAIVRFGVPYIPAIPEEITPEAERAVLQKLADDAMATIAQLAPAVDATHSPTLTPNSDS